MTWLRSAVYRSMLELLVVSRHCRHQELARMAQTRKVNATTMLVVSDRGNSLNEAQCGYNSVLLPLLPNTIYLSFGLTAACAINPTALPGFQDLVMRREPRTRAASISVQSYHLPCSCVVLSAVPCLQLDQLSPVPGRMPCTLAAFKIVGTYSKASYCTKLIVLMLSDC